MPLAIVRAQTAVALVKITRKNPATGTAYAIEDWTAIFQSIRIRSTLPQIDATVYANEANGFFIGGIERLTYDMSGLLTKDDAGTPVIIAAGPTIPLALFQNCTLLMQYDTGCSISASVNFTDGEINRPAGAMGVITAQAVSIGVFVVVWPRAVPA